MYSISVRDHFMIAHSFEGDVFGPAQSLHGATYVVDVELRRPELDEYGIVVDIGLAGQAGAGDAGLRRLLGAREGRDVDLAERGVVERLHDALCLQAAGRGEGSRGTVEGVVPARLAVANEEQSSRRRLRLSAASSTSRPMPRSSESSGCSTRTRDT